MVWFLIPLISLETVILQFIIFKIAYFCIITAKQFIDSVDPKRIDRMRANEKKRLEAEKKRRK